MPASILKTHDTGYMALLAEGGNWEPDTYYAVLATNLETPNQSTQTTLANIANECTDVAYAKQNLADKAVSIVTGNKIMFTCGKITFGTGNISGRYVYIIKGTVAASAGTDKILGHVDLNDGGAADLTSEGAEFSFTPHGTDGLWKVLRTAVPV